MGIVFPNKMYKIIANHKSFISVFFKDALLGVTRMDTIRNEHIRKTAQVEYFG